MSFFINKESEKSLKKISLPADWRLEKSSEKGWTLFTKEGLSFDLDFSSEIPLSRHQPLAKAIGFKGQPFSVLDITSGWGREAFLMAQLGCFVTAVESHPFVFSFVQQSLHFQKVSLPDYLNFVWDDSRNYLEKLKENQYPEVIYMDPMFGESKKSLSQKSMRILKEIVGPAENEKALFQMALRKARKRVVVKRHRLTAPLKKPPTCSFKAHSVCYDVFTPTRISS